MKHIKGKAKQTKESSGWTGVTSCTHFSTAVLQQDVDVLLVLEMVIKVHNVSVVQ